MLQQIVLGNKLHGLFEVVLHRSVILLPQGKEKLIIGLFLIFVNAYLEFFFILPNNHICFLIECSFNKKKVG